MIGLLAISQRRISEVPLLFRRAMYASIDRSQQLILLTGPRGVGKTTLLLQYLHGIDDGVYLSADHIDIVTKSLYHLIEELYLKQGVRTVVIDEVHMYGDRQRHVKSLYDAFPSLKIVLSGSSRSALVKSRVDLSRRVTSYEMQGLSWSEYCKLIHGIDLPTYFRTEIWNDTSMIASSVYGILGDDLLLLRNEYITYGYYTIVVEGQSSLESKIHTMIDKVIYEDISQIYSLKTENLLVLKKLLLYIVQRSPGTININTLAGLVEKGNDTVQKYMYMLMDTGLIRGIYSKKGVKSILSSTPKYMIDNATLHHYLSSDTDRNSYVGMRREVAVTKQLERVGTYHHTDYGDYLIQQGGATYTIEIGGKNKSKKQLTHGGKRVLDDILVGTNDTIPLWLVGLVE